MHGVVVKTGLIAIGENFFRSRCTTRSQKKCWPHVGASNQRCNPMYPGKDQRWFLEFLAWWNIRPRTVLGHFLWARLTGENCSPCYYGQSVRREVRSAATIIAASRPPIGFWGQEKANLCLYFEELAWRRGAESIFARELQKWYT